MSRDERRLIRAIEKNGRGEEVRITLQWFRGRQYVDVRLFFPDRDTGEMRPCQKGVVLGVDHLDELIDGLMEARAVLDDGTRAALEADPDAPRQ